MYLVVMLVVALQNEESGTKHSNFFWLLLSLVVCIAHVSSILHHKIGSIKILRLHHISQHSL